VVPPFDVASIKENRSGRQGMLIQGERGGRFVCDNVSLQALIQRAYNIRDFQISGGPKWLDSTRYDIVARREIGSAQDSTPDVTKPSRALLDQRHEEERLRLQALLADRFNLSVHLATKVLPIYILVVGNSGPRLRVASQDPASPKPATFRAGENEFSAESVSMAVLAEQLSTVLRRKVVDRTDLTGRYDFTLKWSADIGDGTSGDQNQNDPLIFTAIQEQLGLKLQAAKGPVQILVIDNVDKPSEN